ncbi:MAG: lytic transglycosylase domain-containing protein [Halomonadaceae bacterium]|nr:lytic transglycosylase domain-containing protein [Halomonadaceae bacterium]
MKNALKLKYAREIFRGNRLLLTAAIVAWGAVLVHEARGIKNTASVNRHQPVFEFISPVSLDSLPQGGEGTASQYPVVTTEEVEEPADEVLADVLIEGFGLDEKKADDFAEWIEEASQLSGVPVEHLSVLIATESSFRYRAESWAGAIGPAQVMPKFWSEFCDSDLYDPRENIICGARVLAHYRESCADAGWTCAFKKYNVGPSGYRRASSEGAMDRYMTKIRHNQMLIAYRGG